MASDVLGAVAEIIMGQSPPGEACNAIGEGLPLLNGPTEFGFYHPTPVQFTTDARKKSRSGDILFCVRGSTTGRMNWADQTYAIGRGIAALRHKNGVEYQPFLKALIDFRLPDLLAQATGSTFPNVSYSQIAGLDCDIPPLPEQRAIARILGALDDKIELNRRVNRTLEHMAAALFKSWFVDFDPVTAKLEGRQPYGMNASTAALFPAAFQDSELGPIPEGWKVGNIYEIADVVYGAPFASSLFNTTRQGLPLIRIRDLATHEPEVYTNEVHPKQTIIVAGDLIAGMDGEFRAHHWKGPKALLNQRMCLFRPKEGFPSLFVLESIHGLLAFFENAKVGTTVIHLGKADIDTFKVVIPPIEILKCYGLVAQPVLSQIITNGTESRTLSHIRDALLPKLLSGEIRVKAALEQIEQAAG